MNEMESSRNSTENHATQCKIYYIIKQGVESDSEKVRESEREKTTPTTIYIYLNIISIYKAL